MSRKVVLHEFASARSGDKGVDANVGVWVRSDAAYQVLLEQLTPDVVKRHFAVYCRGGVVRHELPNLRALNFILSDALDGGGAASLRTDAQGKTLGLGMLAIAVDVPDDIEL
jgi:hypothetical protein